MGRDGNCRFPGCDVPAERCDLDHVQRWGSPGSETSTDNPHCLCRTHHRQKTAGQWDVTLHRDGSESCTSHGDGHTVTTQPGGVLKRQTFDYRAVQRTKVLSEYNANRITQEKWQEDIFKAARMARNFNFHADHTTPKEVVELLSRMYEERYGSALI